MKKSFIFLSLLCFFFFSLIYSKSLWLNGSIYKIRIKPGDIIKIKFDEKTIMKYRLEQRQNAYEAKKGKKGKGDAFSFFPDLEVNEDDNLRSQNNLSINNESSFALNAKVLTLESNLASLEGYHSTLINGEVFKLAISGEFDINSLGSESSIYSTDIYNLDFRVMNESPTNMALFNQNDLVFTTNYSDIVSNMVVGSNNMTNVQLTTNLSSFKLEFTGIRDNKKKELLMNYLNNMINLLFR